MTLVEFLHPLKDGKKSDQVLAVLYYLTHAGGQDEASVSEIRAGLVKARVKGARDVNVTQALNNNGPNVDRVGPRGVWKLTDTGAKYVINDLGIDVPTTPGTHHQDVSDMEKLAASVSDEATRDYIEESIKCLRVGARRACVVFLWTGAVATIRDAIWPKGAPAIEAALQAHNPRAKFTKKDDFSFVNDAALLQLAQDLGLFDKSQKKQLGHALDLRNDCGHPVKYKLGEKKVASFIEDVVGIVWP